MFRADTWNRIKNICQRMAEGRGRPDDIEAARSLVDQVAPMEEYFAFPGRLVLLQIKSLFRDEAYEELFILVNKIVGALMSESYRRKHINLQSSIDISNQDEDEEEDVDERARRRPYFEVLIVDDISHAQQRQQRDSLADFKRDEDSFTYEPIFVPRDRKSVV